MPLPPVSVAALQVNSGEGSRMSEPAAGDGAARTGGTVSITIVRATAVVESPTASVARMLQVWLPSAMLAVGTAVTDVAPTVTVADRTAPSRISAYEIGVLASVVVSEMNGGAAKFVTVPFAGVWRAKAAGGVESIVIVRAAGVVERPAPSVARMLHVCAPSPSATVGVAVTFRPTVTVAVRGDPSTISEYCTGPLVTSLERPEVNAGVESVVVAPSGGRWSAKAAGGVESIVSVLAGDASVER